MERFAPGPGELVEACEVITSEDMETDYGLTGGPGANAVRQIHADTK